MNRIWHMAMAVGGLAMGAGGSIASEAAWWGPAAPAVRIEVTEGAVQTPTLVLVYGEGGDTFQAGRRGGGQITSCRTLAGVCASTSTGTVFHLGGARRQSLQVRWLTEEGEPAVGGVVWDGADVPRQVDLRCDLAVLDPRAACSIVRLRD